MTQEKYREEGSVPTMARATEERGGPPQEKG